jgi:hypothetical protein
MAAPGSRGGAPPPRGASARVAGWSASARAAGWSASALPVVPAGVSTRVLVTAGSCNGFVTDA